MACLALMSKPPRVKVIVILPITNLYYRSKCIHAPSTPSTTSVILSHHITPLQVNPMDLLAHLMLQTLVISTTRLNTSLQRDKPWQTEQHTLQESKSTSISVQ